MIDNLIFAPAYLYISTVKLQDRKMYERAVWLETPLEGSREGWRCSYSLTWLREVVLTRLRIFGVKDPTGY